MNKVGLNILLSVYQLFGFLISLAGIIAYANREVRMTVFYVYLAIGLFIPFLIIPFASLLSRIKYQKIIKKAIYVSTSLIVLFPLFLPLFFDKELIYISLVGVGVFSLLLLMRKNIENQLLVLNIVGSIFLSIILFNWITVW